MSCSACKRRARMRVPLPTAATMRARRMMDAMTGIAPASKARGIASALRVKFVTAVMCSCETLCPVKKTQRRSVKL